MKGGEDWGPRLDHMSHGHTGTCPRWSFPGGLESLQEDEGSALGSPTSNLGPLAREVALACHPQTWKMRWISVHLGLCSKTLTDRQTATV